MKKNLLTLFISSIFLFGFTSCFEEEPDEPTICPVEQCDRVILVYQAANQTGLDGASIEDLREMQQAVANGLLKPGNRLLVYNYSYNDTPVLMDVRPEGLDTVNSYNPLVPSIKSCRMRHVLDDMKAYAPAKEYGLVLWGHGTGWVQDGIADEYTPMLRSYGGENSRYMNITTMADILSDGPYFDFIYFDCCHMASVEVAWQLRNVTSNIVATVSELPGEGTPYHLALPHLFADGAPDLAAAAASTVDYYREWKEIGTRPEYSPSSFSNRYTAMSVVDTRYLPELAQATAAIYKAAETSYPAGFTPQQFGRSATGLDKYYFDLQQYVLALTDDEALKQQFNNALDKTVVFADTMDKLYGGKIDMKHHCGLSTYIIKDSSSLDDTTNYADLDWYSKVAQYLISN